MRNIRSRLSTGDWLCGFWNVNSLRQRRQRGLLTNLDILNLDIIFLFETQCNIELFQNNEVKSKLNEMGYKYIYEHSSNHPTKKWGYAGVMVLSKHKPLHVLTGLGDDTLDKEGRVITLLFKNQIITGSYLPNSGKPHDLSSMQRKLNFFKHLQKTVNQFYTKDIPWIWGGDTNVAYLPNDKYDNAHSDKNAEHPSCTADERQALSHFIQAFQLTDLILKYNKDPPFTWFFNKHDMEADRGMRIDHIFGNQKAAELVKYATTLPDTYGSDHRPNILLITNTDNLARHA